MFDTDGVSTSQAPAAAAMCPVSRSRYQFPRSRMLAAAGTSRLGMVACEMWGGGDDPDTAMTCCDPLLCSTLWYDDMMCVCAVYWQNIKVVLSLCSAWTLLGLTGLYWAQMVPCGFLWTEEEVGRFLKRSLVFASFYVWFTRCVIGYDVGCRQLKMLLAPIPPLGPASHTSHLPAATHWHCTVSTQINLSCPQSFRPYIKSLRLIFIGTGNSTYATKISKNI